jgi:hypothetical protein
MLQLQVLQLTPESEKSVYEFSNSLVFPVLATSRRYVHFERVIQTPFFDFSSKMAKSIAKLKEKRQFL